jgi:hypothetical protein
MEAFKNKIKEKYPNAEEWLEASRIQPGINFGDVPAPFEASLAG